jgi:4-hydroxy-tetrahydrodipicolinate synthase
MRPYEGLLTAMVTPFSADGRVDEEAAVALGRHLLSHGSHGLVICGTTGESATLTDDEQLSLIATMVRELGDEGAIVAGAGSNDTRHAVHLTERAVEAGAHAVLSVTPYYNKPTPEGLYQHYRAIAESTPLPIVVYNVPGRTGVNVDVATLVRLAAIPNIVAVKEASGNVSQMCDICRAVPPDFIVLSGDDALTLPLMAVGGHGIISVASNEIPAEMVQMVEAAERNDFAAARQVHARILPLMTINFVEANPVPVKAAMADMGLLEESYRLPMVSPRSDSRDKIRRVLSELNLLKAALV